MKRFSWFFPMFLGVSIGFAGSSMLFNIEGIQDAVFGPTGMNYEWRPVPGRPEQHALFLNRKQIGVWDESRREYRTYYSAIGFGNSYERRPPVPYP